MTFDLPLPVVGVSDGKADPWPRRAPQFPFPGDCITQPGPASHARETATDRTRERTAADGRFSTRRCGIAASAEEQEHAGAGDATPRNERATRLALSTNGSGTGRARGVARSYPPVPWQRACYKWR